jgi:hypothetical protein
MPTAAPLTLAAWFRAADVTSSYGLVGLGHSIDNHYFTLEARGGDAGDYIGAVTRSLAAGRAQASSATGYTADQWHHAAAVFTSASNRVAYLNGAPGTANTTSVTPLALTYLNVAAIRAAGAPATLLNGAVAQVAIYRAALSDYDIARLAQGAHPLDVRPVDLWDCWELSRGGPAVGLMRGKVLTPVNSAGLTLTTGPSRAKGPSTSRQFFVEASAAPSGNRRRRLLLCGSR